MDIWFFGQLLGVVATGGFFGEWHRSPCAKTLVFSNVGASAFLAFMLGWGVFEVRGNRTFSLIMAGLLAFQDIDFIKKTGKSVITKNIKMLQGMLEDE